MITIQVKLFGYLVILDNDCWIDTMVAIYGLDLGAPVCREKLSSAVFWVRIWKSSRLKAPLAGDCLLKAFLCLQKSEEDKGKLVEQKAHCGIHFKPGN